jgi:hypothetical protein
VLSSGAGLRVLESWAAATAGYSAQAPAQGGIA